MPQYIIWICCIIIMPLPFTIALAVFHSHIHAEKHNADTHTQMQECAPCTIFDDEMFAHCRSEIEKPNWWKVERVQHKDKASFCLMSGYSLTLHSVLCVRRSAVVTSGDNIETSWTRARSTRDDFADTHQCVRTMLTISHTIEGE